MDKLALRSKERETLARKLRNVNINDCTEAFLGIVKDKQRDTIFYEYEPKAKIAKSIYAELLDKYRAGKGFILSDDMEETGILTQAQGACSLDVLIGSYGVISSLSGQDAQELKDIYEKTIRDVLDRIRGDEEGYQFSATPYNISIFNREYAYLDAMTWVGSALLGALTLNDNAFSYANSRGGKVRIAFTEAEVSEMLDVLSYCVRYMVNCYIDASKTKHNSMAKGWNFTKNCGEPSLYFTYAVSEFYLDIFSTFRQVIDRHNIDLKIQRVKDDPQHELSQENDVWLYISPDDRAAYERINVRSEEFKQKSRLFDRINGMDGLYYRLEQQVKESAKNIWSLVKDGIDSNFYNYNLSSFVDPQTIESSSTSDALFNTIFVINNVISGGLDEDLMDMLAWSADDEEMSRIQGEYDDLLETLQAALQRTIRYLKTLRAKRKEYIVNDFIISCSESFEGDVNRKAQELRKKRVKSFTISPLLVKTNNLISEYLTKYPQIDMVKYLDELLMKKRTTVEEKTTEGDSGTFYIWIWENGEYLVTSNYYYILSLSNFYEYVENYESRFSAIDHDNARFRESIILKHDQESRSNGEIFQLTQEKNALQETNDQLQQRVGELETRESEVESALRGFLQQELRTNLLTWLTDGLHDMNQGLLEDLDHAAFSSERGKEISFMKEFRRTLAVAFHEQMKHRLDYVGDSDQTASFALTDQMVESAEAAVDKMITDITNSAEFSSRKKRGNRNV